MSKLSFIEAEARSRAGKLSGPRREALQHALVELCEEHWRELRGPEPPTPLAHALWSVPPPLAELLVDLHASGDSRLADTLDGLRPTRALALLVLAEIERGDIEGIHIAHEAMMALDSPAAGRIYGERIAAALHGALPLPARHRHAREPLWKALAIVVAHIGRHDIQALIAVIRLLAVAPGGSAPPGDDSLAHLRAALDAVGVRFRALDGDTVQYELHGHAHKPIRLKRLGDLLAEIRQARLA
jgi:hypothetical protein